MTQDRWTYSKVNVLCARTRFFTLAVKRISSVLEKDFDGKKVGNDVEPVGSSEFLRTFVIQGRKVYVSRDDWFLDFVDVIFEPGVDPSLISSIKSRLEAIRFWI